MKTAGAGQSFYDTSMLEETELALAVSPCPRIDGSPDIGEGAERGSESSTPGEAASGGLCCPRQWPYDDDAPDEILTIAWAIALALAVALTNYLSRG